MTSHDSEDELLTAWQTPSKLGTLSHEICPVGYNVYHPYTSQYWYTPPPHTCIHVHLRTSDDPRLPDTSTITNR